MGAGARAHPWGGVSPFKTHYSIAFEHQSITGRPPLGEILYSPLPWPPVRVENSVLKKRTLHEIIDWATNPEWQQLGRRRLRAPACDREPSICRREDAFIERFPARPTYRMRWATPHTSFTAHGRRAGHG